MTIPNGSLEARVRQLERRTAQFDVYWEAQKTLNAEVRDNVKQVNGHLEIMQGQMSKTEQSVRNLTRILSWVLGIVSAVGIGLLVKVII